MKHDVTKEHGRVTSQLNSATNPSLLNDSPKKLIGMIFDSLETELQDLINSAVQ